MKKIRAQLIDYSFPEGGFDGNRDMGGQDGYGQVYLTIEDIDSNDIIKDSINFYSYQHSNDINKFNLSNNLYLEKHGYNGNNWKEIHKAAWADCRKDHLNWLEKYKHEGTILNITLGEWVGGDPMILSIEEE